MTLRISSAALIAVLALGACGPQETQTAANTAAAPEVSVAPAAETAVSAPPPVSASTEEHRFQTKTGRVTYAMSGMQTGTEVMTWDDWGARQVTETKSTMSMGGTSMTRNARVIMTPESFQIVDDTAKTAMKVDRDSTAMMSAEEMRDLSTESMARMGASQTGTDTIAGKNCDIYKMTPESMPQMNMTLCVWAGLPLMTEGDMAGVKLSKLASSVETDIAVDPALFQVPAGYTQTTPGPGMMGMPGMPQGAPMPQGMPSVPASPSTPN